MTGCTGLQSLKKSPWNNLYRMVQPRYCRTQFMFLYSIDRSSRCANYLTGWESYISYRFSSNRRRFHSIVISIIVGMDGQVPEGCHSIGN